MRSFWTRMSVAILPLLAIVSVQSQEIQKEQKKEGAAADLTPVTLSMKWTRGSPQYGSNFIRLSTPCQASAKVSCECSMEFKAINSQEFADYISSFGDNRVPAVYQVLYRPGVTAQGVRLESVGSWRAYRFQVNDRLLQIRFNFKSGKPGRKQGGNFHLPADCFPPIAN